MKSYLLQSLILVSLVAVGYSLSVLVRDGSTYDLRVYSLFPNSESDVGARVARVGGDIDARLAIPRIATAELPGDIITHVPAKVLTRHGWSFEMQPVLSFPHFIRAIADLSPTLTEIPPDGVVEGDFTAPTDLDAETQARLPPLVDIGRDRARWARLELLRTNATGETETVTSWLRLQPTPLSSILISLAWFFLKMIIFVIGALVVTRRPSDTSARMFFALCAITVVAFMGGFHWSSLLGSPWLLYPFVLCAMLVPPVTLHFYLLFPQPHLVVRRWPWQTMVAVYGLPGLFTLLLFGAMIWSHQVSDDPDQLAAPLVMVAQLISASLALSAVWFIAGLGVLVHRFLKTETQVEQNQVKWLLSAAIPATVPLGMVLYTATTNPAEFAYGTTTKPLMLVASGFFTIAYAVSITRYRLMQAGRFLNRGLWYFAISFAAMALFCLMVGMWALISGSIFIWGNVLVVGLTAMVVLVLMGWAGNRYQMASEVQFHREKFQLDKAMRRLGKAVEQLVEPAQLVQQMLQSALDAVSASSGAVYLKTAGSEGFERVATHGRMEFPRKMAFDSPLAEELRTAGLVSRWAGSGPPPSAGRWHLDDLGGELASSLEAGDVLVGFVLLGPKDESQPYTPEDRNFLIALARTTSLALESAQGHHTITRLREELQAKVDQIAEQQQRILFLQGELVNRTAPPASSPSPENAGRSSVALRHEIRGSSPVVQTMLGKVSKIARSSSSVLIRGESGTGKELLAQAIHGNSARGEGPFVQVHCAALSQGLLESELFGHVKGAFTGADRDKIGRFEMADCGTLFLDEIGDISLETQTKLLRALQEQAFERVGGTETIRVDVRLIAATHRNLEELIRQGRFREDLFYRLNVISLLSPPLRERGDDIVELAYHFLRQYASRVGKSIARIDRDALAILVGYSWPGNIRQLENAVERAVVLAEGDSITVSDWPPEILASPKSVSPSEGRAFTPARGQAVAGWSPPRPASPSPVSSGALTLSSPGSLASSSTLESDVERFERERLAAVLTECQGNKSEAARILGLPRSTLFSKLRKYNLG